MPTIEQIRAARALIGWSQKDLADHSNLSQTGIARIENGTNKPNSSTIMRITGAFEAMGINFIQGGVQKVQDTLIVSEGDDCLRRLQDDIFHTLKPQKGEVLLLGIDEITPEEKENYDYTLMHIERLQNAGISERIIVREDKQEFIAPKSWYRKVSQNYFSPHTVFIYDTKIALALRQPHNKVLLLDNPFFSESMRNFFNMLWDSSEAIE
ncbi:helix-turn-helix domain-containing protein [uncultured Muriicola sp.]|uniref:helix-turn-helix domain-containing protein n=1 Tax=uncultured Muriicola sp. TaxID=1583102 RepID=UPI00262F9782|nr:helix-turn-helix domain-containing protein [uncultured Muriicola sp.]